MLLKKTGSKIISRIVSIVRFTITPMTVLLVVLTITLAGIVSIQNNQKVSAIEPETTTDAVVLTPEEQAQIDIIKDNEEKYKDFIAYRRRNDLDWQIQSLLYFNVISNCINGSKLGGGRSTDDGKKGYIFTDGDIEAMAGEYGRTMDLANEPNGTKRGDISNNTDWNGLIACNRAEILSGAAKHWGIGILDIACNAGMKWYNWAENQTVDFCLTAPPNSYVWTEKGLNLGMFYAYIKAKIYGGMPVKAGNWDTYGGNLFSATNYIYYRHNLSVANGKMCTGNIDSQKPAETKSGDAAKNYSGVRWVATDGTISDLQPFGGQEARDAESHSIYLDQINDGAQLNANNGGAFGGNQNLFNISCDKMAQSMSFNADAYSAYLKALAAEEALKTKAGIGTTDENDDSADNSKSKCQNLGALGWILCPVINFLSGAADNAKNILTDNFLRVQPSILSTDAPTDTTYKIWSNVRTIANILFVIFFLIIIFSQVTGFGISNYGLKKMMPKLIVAAILVNLSFLICQIAVDLSNVIGYSADGFFNSIKGGQISLPPESADSVVGSGVFTGISTLMLAGGAVGIVVLFAGTIIPILLGVLVAALTILLLLIGRQALIILLVIMSPLAFVAYILPNTKKLFDKWTKTFMSMLMLFPIVAVVFGASRLASDVLTSAWGVQVPDQGKWIEGVAAASVAVLPLFVVPGILKKSMDGIGQIGAKINGLGDKARAKTTAMRKEAFGRSAGGKILNARKQFKNELANSRYAQRMSGKGSKYLRGIGGIGMTGKHADQFGAQLEAGGIDEMTKQNDKNVAVSSTQLKNSNLTQKQIADIATGVTPSSHYMRQAAIKSTMASGNIENINDVYNSMGKDQLKEMEGTQEAKDLRNATADSLGSAPNKPTFYGAKALEEMRIGNGGTASAAASNAAKGDKYSPEKTAGASTEELSFVYVSTDDEGRTKLESSAASVIGNDTLRNELGGNKEMVESMAKKPTTTL
ncbi:MAG: hypothetical protein WCP11_00510 [Candidatus Saccharibacteria bacterium]